MKKILLSGLLAVLLTCSACAGTGGVKVATESAASSQAAASSAAAETTGTAEPFSEVTSAEAPSTEAPSTVETQPETNDDAWKEAYISYVNSLFGNAPLDNATFELTDIDGNGIPELYFDSGIAAYGASLTSYSQDGIQTLTLRAGRVSYLENRIANEAGKMGYYTRMVFELNDGWFSTIFEGTMNAKTRDFNMDNPDDFTYSYHTEENSEEQSVSYEEFSRVYNTFFDDNSATVIKGRLDRDAVINVIQSY